MTSLLTCLLVAAATAVMAQQDQPHVAAFRGDRKAAVSLTFDDGSRNQVDVAVPLLNEYGIKGTFFLITGQVAGDQTSAKPTWTDWRRVAQQGHEIGNHSMSHRHLTKLTDPAELVREIVNSAEAIRLKTGKKPVSFAYPFCAFNEKIEALVLEHHAVARGYQPIYGGKDFDSARANAWIDEAIEKHGWHVGLLHGVGAEKAYKPTSEPVLRAHCKYLHDKADDVWTAPYGEVGRYLQQHKHARLQIQEQQVNSLTFVLSLDKPAEFDPVQMTVVIPASATRATASRQSATVTIRNGNCLLVDLLPSDSPVTISWE